MQTMSLVDIDKSEYARIMAKITEPEDRNKVKKATYAAMYSNCDHVPMAVEIMQKYDSDGTYEELPGQ